MCLQALARGGAIVKGKLKTKSDVKSPKMMVYTSCTYKHCSSRKLFADENV